MQVKHLIIFSVFALGSCVSLAQDECCARNSTSEELDRKRIGLSVGITPWSRIRSVDSSGSLDYNLGGYLGLNLRSEKSSFEIQLGLAGDPRARTQFTDYRHSVYYGQGVYFLHHPRYYGGAGLGFNSYSYSKPGEIRTHLSFSLQGVIGVQVLERLSLYVQGFKALPIFYFSTSGLHGSVGVKYIFSLRD